MACLSLPRLWTLVSQRCNNFLLPGSSRSSCFKFVVDGFFLGLIRHDALSTLLSYPEVFVWTSDPITGEQCITLHPSLNTPYERTSAVSDAMLDLRAAGTVPALKGWRNEDYGVYAHNRGKTLFCIERSASALLGITRYGCHINGFVVLPETVNGIDQISTHEKLQLKDSFGQIDASRVMMWLGVRSSSKPTWPGMLDNMAAGGLTFGLDPMECARKECQEEASVPEALLGPLTPVSRLSYIFEDDRGVCPQVEYCFDLELPCDFVPVSADGEVDSFRLVSISQVKELILSEQFKANSAMVVLDFLYRHKFIDPESDPLHKDIISLMHVKFDFD
ncbi:Nudix hydrolase 20, chloroplastic [Clonorchis sinensis]|uniref:Nudix hydrolase 20, chloroplastic n=2 Tax=Clonorchis sinensis TaxID=79923 RepID=A0A8T1MNR6_CLOSI|nr:Nudix hydrolase 20, chloroplastic [Clonorchis sinensis]GAA49418.1 nudix hydrolase 20 chloroplastic [Clonorchis sinensis]